MTDAGRQLFFDQFAVGPKNRHIYQPIQEPRHPNSIQLVSFWREREHAGGLTVGRDIPCRAIAAILRNLMIYEPLEASGDFRIRHAGTAFIAHYGFDATGMLMSQLFEPDTFKHNSAKAMEVIRSGKPEILDANLNEYGISRRHYEVVQLPVWGRDKTARWMLCGIFRFD